MPTPWTWGRPLRWVLGLELIFVLALAQVMFAGYRLGVGNQSIQIPFLKHWMDPKLYANDPMVKQTLADYPSFFFRLLATVVTEQNLYSAYFWLHVATAAAVLAAAYFLGRAIFKDRVSGVVLALLMLAGHHKALAGDDLYSVGFTHTWAVFPLALWAITLLYKEWYWAAFALVGIIFNLHALTAGYLLAMFLTWAIFDYRQVGWRWRLGGMLILFALLASPTMLDMLQHRQHFGAEWLERTRVRSADHSFASSWWTTGARDIPRFALLAALAGVSLAFSAPWRNQRKSLLMAAGVGGLFLIGFVFSDIWPVATVVRAQLFRSSRLLVVLMLAHIAHSIVSAWRLALAWPAERRGREAWRGSSDEPVVADIENTAPVGMIGRLLEVLLATAMFVILALPGLTALAPWLLLAAVGVAVLNGRLGLSQAIVAGLALLVVAAAWRTIDYDIPGIDGALSLEVTRQGLREAGRWLWIALGAGALVWVMLRLPVGPRTRLCVSVAVFYACVLISLHGQRWLADVATPAQDPWVQVQLWAERSTPKDALFMTPPEQGGFRIYSDRSVVCEWRDGTQLYFSADFAKDWWDKLTTLRPVSYDAQGTKELMQGKTLQRMDDREIIKLAKSYGATHVVLPAGQNRELNRKFSNGAWAVYEPRILDAQDAFIENVALPNIEKYRKSNARLELSDADGRTLTEGTYEINQTRQAFGFGVSIPFFQDPVGDPGPDFEPPPVTPKELAMVKGVFNYSVIPFSAKWQRLEPEEGQRHYEELDKYVDWCAKNGIRMEFHYLSGFTPRWVQLKSREEQKEAWLRHCRQCVDRYHDRIKYWQVINDSRLTMWAAEAFREIHAKYPDLKLGTSNCSQFYSPYSGVQALSGGMMLGASEIEELQAEGVKVDFFSSHGHKPMGVWPDMRMVYEALDAFASYGVKVHVSEATLDIGLAMVSQVRTEQKWSPELAAEFFEKYYTVLFSHPAMEAINYWDLSASIVRPMGGRGGMQIGGTGQAGLLDPNNNDAPRPLYLKLKELIHDRWMTRISDTLARDGAVAFRGFHGDYEITVRIPSGKVLKGTFSVQPDSENKLQLKLIEEGAGSSVAAGR